MSTFVELNNFTKSEHHTNFSNLEAFFFIFCMYVHKMRTCKCGVYVHNVIKSVKYIKPAKPILKIYTAAYSLSRLNFGVFDLLKQFSGR